MGEAADSQYFRVPHPIWWVLIPLGMALASVAPFRPDLIPVKYLGPVGTLIDYICTNHPDLTVAIFVIGWTLHVGEALYSLKVCHDKRIESPAKWKWAAQTLVLGFASLGILNKFQPKKQS